MKVITDRKKNQQGEAAKPGLLQLNERESDVFLDLFLPDFSKISSAIQEKVKRHREQQMIEDRMRREGTIPPEHQSQQAESKFTNPPEPKDQIVSLSFDEFMLIDFGFKEGERFQIINDILEYLTGQQHTTLTFQQHAPQLPDKFKSPNFPNYGNDENLSHFRDIMPKFFYDQIEISFKRLWGFPVHMLPDSEVDGVPFLTEKHFTQNIKRVTGYDCPYFGKLLYLYFAKGLDKSRVTMVRFFEGLAPFA